MADLENAMYDEQEDTQKDRYLTFIIDEECYGIEIRYVTEIIGMQPITNVAEQPIYIKGIINLRGKIIPVMDIRLRFKKEPIDYNDRTCIIVIDIDSLSIGLIVDSVAEVITIGEESITVPPTIGNVEHKYLKHIGKVKNEVKLLLNCTKLLLNDDEEVIENYKDGNKEELADEMV